MVVWTAALLVSARPESGAGVTLGPRRSGRFIASVCASMLIVAAGVSFAESEPARQELSSPTPSLWVRQLLRSLRWPRQLDRVAGMIKKAVSRSSGRSRVRGEDDKVQDPCHQDCCFRSAARRAPEYGHPHRSVICTHLCAERLAHSPHTRQNEWRGRQSQRRSELRGAGPVPPPPDRHARSHMQHRLLHLRVRRARGRRPQRPPGTRTSGTSRCSV